MAVILGNGDGTFGSPTDVATGYQVTVGDFNNDSKIDFAAYNITTGKVELGLNDGIGGFTVSIITVPTASIQI